MGDDKGFKLPDLCCCESCKAVLSTTEVEIQGILLSIRGMSEMLSALALAGIGKDKAIFEEVYHELSKINEDLTEDLKDDVVEFMRAEYSHFI